MDSGPIIPRPAQKRRRRDKITEKQAMAAAEACGLTVLKIGGLKNEARIGAYLEQLGAIKVGRSGILTASHKAEESVKQIESWIAQNDGALPIQIELMKLKAAFLGLVLSSAQAQIKVPSPQSENGHASAPLMMAFPPGTQIAARVPENPLQPTNGEIKS